MGPEGFFLDFEADDVEVDDGLLDGLLLPFETLDFGFKAIL